MVSSRRQCSGPLQPALADDDGHAGDAQLLGRGTGAEHPPARCHARVSSYPAALATQRRPVGRPGCGGGSGAAAAPVSAPVTANQCSSAPEITKMIGATQPPGRLTVVSISESPFRVAGKGLVVMLTVDTLPWPSSVRQL